jgi:hypothetical protein
MVAEEVGVGAPEAARPGVRGWARSVAKLGTAVAQVGTFPPERRLTGVAG